MAIFALCAGQLFRDPKSAISKGGRPFTVATLKVLDAGGSPFVKVFAWSDSARAELEKLRDGAPVSVSGKLQAEIYTPSGGEARVSLSVVADQVLALKKPAPASRKNEQEQPNPGRKDFQNDEIPF